MGDEETIFSISEGHLDSGLRGIPVGDVVISDMSMGKVKAITNSSGEKIKQAGPSSAVEVLGLDTAPNAGSSFQVVKNEKAAREVIDFRDSKQKEKFWVPWCNR